jgi:hypothetical protein
MPAHPGTITPARSSCFAISISAPICAAASDEGSSSGTTEASTSGLTETQLMKKGQWSSTKAMAHYLHHDDQAKQDAQIKRIKRRKRAAKK